MAESTRTTAPAATDADVRAQGLDPARSFIVQAPAGSGKTELLIQRLLVLLAHADEPEQVLAITFTRKAAAEMRARLLDALAATADPAAPQPTQPHEAETRGRARAVLERDAARGWALLESPGRLRIQTIDSLCAALTRERPIRSGLGEAPGIAEDPAPLYQEAARATLALLEELGAADGDASGAGAAAVERLLLHLDDNHARAETLLCAMLARRDQWLRHGLSAEAAADPAALRAALEAELHAAVADALAALRAALLALAERRGIALEAELAALLAHAMEHTPPDGPLGALAGLAGLPPATPEALPQWQALSALLTTQGGTWRRSLTKNQGFPTDREAGDPAALKAAKARAQALLDALAAEPEAAARLRAAAALPPPVYTDAQWAVLAALLALLPVAVRQLRMAFSAAGETDYAEVALAAVQALERSGADGGETPDAPEGDEARHILVDEFQDTSHAQFRLLECLTAGWPTDGSRTLFLVGDPMQSIYRFREAEVGLFLRARQAGIGALRLEPLTLRVNFRSTSALVGWVNDVFPAALADREDPATGAVPFTPAEAHPGNDTGAGPAVSVHAFLQSAEHPSDAVSAEEAARVAEIVAAARRDAPAQSVAVLVRTRSHLAAVVPALQQAGLAFRAVEIEALGERPEVRDVLMLARALVHLGDRVAWLAVLRAPWCGLTLEALLHLAAEADEATLWERLRDASVVDGLSPDAQIRVHRVVSALEPAMQHRERRPLRRLVEGAWLALGAPAALPSAGRERALANVEACLARLDALPVREPTGDPEAFEALLERLYAAPDPAADEDLQVMSIHRAKGLQFDTVIVPGLGRVPRHDDPPLLRWFERPVPAQGASGGGAGLLLAPIHEAGPERDPVYDYLDALEKEKAGHETGRLLYVAVTRAKRALHLLGHTALGDEGPRAPDRRSLLARLWPALEPDFLARAEAEHGNGDGPAAAPAAAPAPDAAAALHRLVGGWEPPMPPPDVTRPTGMAEAAADDAADTREPIEFRWAGETARHVGTVVHRLLNLMARQHADAAGGAPQPDAGTGAPASGAIAAALGALGVPAGERDAARRRVEDALARTLADERGRWVLAPHSEARSEYALTTSVEGRPAHYIIDRTFVDEQGVRWIVDFKTGVHEGGDVETFLDREQERYRAQLEGYARLLARLEPDRPIRLALYFPLLQAWREWSPPA